MKRLLTDILRVIGFILSFLYIDRLNAAFSSIRDKVYTGYLSRRFRSFGKSIIMWHPYAFQGQQYMSIGDDNVFEPDVQITAMPLSHHTPSITIGNGCLIRRGTHITAVNSITIGDNLLTGTNVLITDNSHGSSDIDQLTMPVRQRPVISKGAVVIGDNVWLGNNVCIMPGVTIGKGAIVGANSVVTHDVPDYHIAVGAPAKSYKRN